MEMHIQMVFNQTYQILCPLETECTFSLPCTENYTNFKNHLKNAFGKPQSTLPTIQFDHF
jgi:hypothetical protein